jgi:predicted nucleic acid-binding Zn ribbon protein
MSEVKKCPKCGERIVDKGAIYCPYCREPLSLTLRRRRSRAILLIGAVFTVIGAMTVAFIQPRVDYSSYVYPEASLELWFSGVIALVLGIGFIVYGYLRRETGLEAEQNVNQSLNENHSSEKEGVKP